MAVSRAGIAILLIPGLMGQSMSKKGLPPIEKEGEEGYKAGGRKRKRRAIGGQIGELATPRLDKRPRAMGKQALIGPSASPTVSPARIGKPAMTGAGMPPMKRGGRSPAIAAEAKEEGESYAHEAKEKRSGKEDDDDDEKDDRAGMAYGGRLTAGERQAMPRSDFALPGQGEGPKGAGAGSYPIENEGHARSALSRVSQYGSPEQKERVRAAVHRKYPEIGQS